MTPEYRDMRVRSDFPRWLLTRGVVRPDVGPCPACGADEWCAAACPLIDPMDWR